MPEKNLQDRLKSIYADNQVQRDMFGKRPPTSREVESVIRPGNFGQSLDQFLPTEKDVKEKGDQ